MKTIQKIFILLLFSNTFIGIQAQSFRYDTVPNPNKQAERPLFKYEQPVAQESNYKNENNNPEVEKKSSFDKSKISLGGTFGFGFSNYYTSIQISPQVGYTFSRIFTAGAGISYSYYHYSDYDLTQNYLGFNVFGRINPVKYITLQFQPEIYRMWGSHQNQSIESRNVPCFLVGGGITVPAGRGGISAMLFYDVVQDDYSPYGNEVFYSVGYVFNF